MAKRDECSAFEFASEEPGPPPSTAVDAAASAAVMEDDSSFAERLAAMDKGEWIATTTRPDTPLPKSRVGGQGPIFEVTRPLG